MPPLRRLRLSSMADPPPLQLDLGEHRRLEAAGAAAASPGVELSPPGAAAARPESPLKVSRTPPPWVFTAIAWPWKSTAAAVRRRIRCEEPSTVSQRSETTAGSPPPLRRRRRATAAAASL
ncbi:uncharacterized protein LOC131001201 [Salvia miltiorrhiza]|uniref:uncharacterized protein LOC131001201 n=1 Tax=Salvia miltiorrhiza TaxID=226208 RepID=UPI0025AD0963|nr:uncharacterized protein LOC131001201 [Salvia miltiorrhiza]